MALKSCCLVSARIRLGQRFLLACGIVFQFAMARAQVLPVVGFDGQDTLSVKPAWIDVEFTSTGPYISASATFQFAESPAIREWFIRLDKPMNLTGWGVDGQMAKAMPQSAWGDSCIRHIDLKTARFPNWERVPTTPGKPIRIKLEWEQWLNPAEGGFHHEFPAFLFDADSLSIRYTSFSQAFCPELKSTAKSKCGSFQKVKDKFEWTCNMVRPEKGSQIKVFLPDNLDPWIFQLERNGKDSYFLACIRHGIETGPAKRPSKLALVWDNSRGGAGRNHAIELAVVDSLVRRLGKVEVLLVPFGYHEDGRVKINLQNGDITPLYRAIATLNPDGAARPSAVDWHSIRAEWILFVGEGTPQWGPPPDLSPKGRFIAFHAGTPTRNPWLYKAAARSGGVNLGRIDNAGTAAQAILQEKPSILKIKHGSSFSEVYPISNLPEGLAALSGKFHEKSGKLKISVGKGTQPTFKAALAVEWDAQRSKGARLMLLNKRTMVDRVAELTAIPSAEIMNQCLKHDLKSPWTKLTFIDEAGAYLMGKRPPPAAFTLVDSLRKAAIEWKSAQDSLLRHQELMRISEVSEDWKLRSIWWEEQMPNKKAPATKAVDGPSKAKNGFGKQEEWQPTLKRGALGMGKLAEGFLLPNWKPDHAPTGWWVDGVPTAGIHDSLLSEGLELKWVEGPVCQAWMGETAAGGVVMARTRKSGGLESPEKTLVWQAWDSIAPYFKAVESIPDGQLKALYHQLKRIHIREAAFYLKFAEEAGKRGLLDFQLQILSNLVLNPNSTILRQAGRILMRSGQSKEALDYLILATRLPNAEPHAFRDFGLALEEAMQVKQASEVLFQALKMNWSDVEDYFAGIQAVMLNDLVGIMGKHNLPRPKDWPTDWNALPCDIRITAEWNRMDLDVDLYVIEPDGSRCDHQHPDSPSGGFFPVDFADGFGPEEYLLRKASPGNYQIGLEYYMEDDPNPIGPPVVTLRITRNHGRPDARTEKIEVALRGAKGDKKSVALLTWPATKP